MKVLVCSKKSLYEVYKNNIKSKRYLKKIIESNNEHIKTQEYIFATLKKLHIPYTSIYRDDLTSLKNPNNYDLTISCGGDGTLLHVQKFMTKGKIFSVNSDRKNSVGYFAIANRFNFERQFQKYLDNKLQEVTLTRLMLKINNTYYTKHIFNDVLFSNETVSLSSRYEIHVRGKNEMQKSSGIWISTAAGSSGALRSAGGKSLALASPNFQFLVREPDYVFHYTLLNKILKPNESLVLYSRMTSGICYIDGTADSVRFDLGDRLTFSTSHEPITLIR